MQWKQKTNGEDKEAGGGPGWGSCEVLGTSLFGRCGMKGRKRRASRPSIAIATLAIASVGPAQQMQLTLPNRQGSCQIRVAPIRWVPAELAPQSLQPPAVPACCMQEAWQQSPGHTRVQQRSDASRNHRCTRVHTILAAAAAPRALTHAFKSCLYYCRAVPRRTQSPAAMVDKLITGFFTKCQVRSGAAG